MSESVNVIVVVLMPSCRRLFPTSLWFFPRARLFRLLVFPDILHSTFWYSFLRQLLCWMKFLYDFLDKLLLFPVQVVIFESRRNVSRVTYPLHCNDTFTC